MADVKISALPAATTPLDGTELTPIVQSGTTKRVSVANLTVGRALTASSLTLSSPLSAANGGTGVTTSTGTGSVVLSTSPTFTTSALFPAGTVGAPGISVSGDTNTGIYFPAADTVAVATNGTEDMRFTPEGNVTLNSATFSPTTPGTAGNMAMTGTLAMGSSFLRNRIINGAMVIDQRNNGASVTPAASAYLLDRWRIGIAGPASKLSFQQSSDAPSGFVNSLLATVVSAHTIVASDILSLGYTFEGRDVADLGWGTSAARTITLSFWVKCSLTGSFGGAFVCVGGTNSFYPFAYTINSANTWEYKTITVTGPTTNPGYTDSQGGAQVFWSMGMGSTFSGPANVWSTTQYRSATGTVNLVETSGATWQMTGVQFEVGSVATPFERRQYGTELMLCQRYCYRQTGGKISDASYYTTTQIFPTLRYPVTMRAAPSSITFSSQTGFNVFSAGTGRASTAMGVSGAVTADAAELSVTTAAATQGNGGAVIAATATDWVQASAEL